LAYLQKIDTATATCAIILVEFAVVKKKHMACCDKLINKLYCIILPSMKIWQHLAQTLAESGFGSAQA
jgi:hypothetical protein